MADRHAEEYSRDAGSLLYPPDDWATVTPGASAFASPAVCIYVGGTGDVTAITLKGTTVVFKAVPVGTIIWGRFTHITAASTATLMLIGL